MSASRKVRRVPLHLVVIVLALIWLSPSLGLLVSSFRPRQDLLASGWWTAVATPSEWGRFTTGNYQDVLLRQGMGRAFLNSFIITVPTTLITLTIAALAAYALSWMEFRGRQVLLMTVVGLIVIPLQMTLIPVLRMFNVLRLSGTFPGIWLAHAGYGLPLMIYLLRNFFGALPRELFESAYMDGATPFTAFLRLVLPLSVPVLASAAIFQFLWVWNDYLVALTFLGVDPSYKVVTQRLADLTGTFGNDWQLLTAGAFVTMILPMVVFFALQRYFVRGLLAGSVKG